MSDRDDDWIKKGSVPRYFVEAIERSLEAPPRPKVPPRPADTAAPSNPLSDETFHSKLDAVEYEPKIDDGSFEDLEFAVTKTALVHELKYAKAARDAWDQHINELAVLSHDAGISWGTIGKAIGITQQAAHKRWATKPQQPDDDIERGVV